MYKEKNTANEDGKKPLNYRQVKNDSGLMHALAGDYSQLMKSGAGYRGKSSVVKDALSRKYNVSGNAVSYAVKQENIEGKFSRKIGNEEALQIVDMYNEGASASAIAETLGRSSSSVYKILNDYRNDHARFREVFKEMKPTPLNLTPYQAIDKKSWFGKYIVPAASAAALFLAATGIFGCGAKSSKPVPNSRPAVTCTAKTLESKVIDEAKTEEKPSLENLAKKKPKTEGGDGGDDPKPEPYNIAASGNDFEEEYNIAENMPEEPVAKDRPITEPQTPSQYGAPAEDQPAAEKPKTEQPRATPEEIRDLQERIREINDYGKPKPETSPEVKPEQPKPAASKEFDNKLGLWYESRSGDVSGDRQRANVDYTVENSGKTYRFSFDFANEENKFESRTGEDVTSKSTSFTPSFEFESTNYKFGATFNNVSEGQRKDKNSRTVTNGSDSGVTWTQTTLSDSDDKWNRDLNSVTLTGKAHGFLFRADAATDESNGSNRTQQTDSVHFTNPLGLSDIVVSNDVESNTESETTAWRVEGGYEFKFDNDRGLFVPSVIGGQYKNSSEANALLNDTEIMNERDRLSIDTFGARVKAKWNDKFAISGLYLHNTGDVENDNQENEYAGRIVVAPANWLTLGGGAERFDGANRVKAGVLFGTGNRNLETLDDFFETQERFRETPWLNTPTQRSDIMTRKALDAGQSGILIYGGCGEFNSEGGDYANAGAALSLDSLPLLGRIPGAKNVELQAEFEKWNTDDSGDHMGGRSFGVGPAVKIPGLDWDVALRYVKEHDEQMGDSNMVTIGLSIPLGKVKKAER